MTWRKMGDNTGWAWAGACALGLGLLACGGAVDDADWAELEEEEAALYGQSEQALMRVDFDMSAAGTGVFEPGDPEPPQPATCKTDPIADVRAALGYRVLRAFGSTHPSIWECVPSLIAGCPSVRLSLATQSTAVANGQHEEIGQVQELLDALTELGGMPAFADAYERTKAACAADPKTCSSTRKSYTFTPNPVNECGEVVFDIGSSNQTVVRGDAVGALGGSLVLAKSGSSTKSLLGAAAGVSLAVKATTTLAPASPTPSTGTADSQVRRDEMGSYYGLYGGYHNPCRPGEGCTATGANTAVKTFLDQTCEASTAADACYHPTYDANYLAFRHNLTGFPGAVRKRAGEACDYGPGSEIRDGELVASPGRILALCVAQ